MTAQKYTYSLPEDYILEPQFREKLDMLVEEAQMSNELAQKFVDLHIELTEDFVNRLQEAVAADEQVSDPDKLAEKTKSLQVTEYGPEVPQQ